MSISKVPRAGFYVDGFNLYHAIDDLGKPYLKWLSLMKLCQRFSRQFKAEVAEIVFCTAYFRGDFGKLKRHETYVAALQSEGVAVLFGHETKEDVNCRVCGAQRKQAREKETDINVALSLFEAAASGRIDQAFLISGDTDQAATLRFMTKYFPHVNVVVLVPPKRPIPSHLQNLSWKAQGISETDLDLSVLPGMLNSSTGRLITRPPSYTPPPGWVHPDDRP